MNRREFMKGSLTSLAAASLVSRSAFAAEGTERRVRFAVIGVGGRGTYLMQTLLQWPEVEVTAICDINPDNLNRAIEMVEKAKGNTPAGYSKDEYDYRNMVERDDFEAVLIATPTKWHGVMAADAMNAGKHVGSEVPACDYLKDCRAIVEAKEKNNVHYMLLENYVFSEPSLAVLNMVKQGLFGEPYYAECGYIHEYKVGQYEADGSLNWRGELVTSTTGNHYPTHSGGPIFKWLDINQGDRLAKLTCYATTPNRTAPMYYAGRFGQEKADQLTWTLGEMTTCLIGTAKGKVVKMDLDIQSNRPHSFYYLLQGTQGIVDNRFGVSHLDPEQDPAEHPHFEWKPLEEYLARYRHPLWEKYSEQARTTAHGGGDYFTIMEFLNMVKEDREPFIDVYDAAAWSAIYECSRQSLAGGNCTVEIPDFTSGRWEQPDWRQDPLMA